MRSLLNLGVAWIHLKFWKFPIPIENPNVAAEKEEIFNQESAQFQEEIQIQPNRKSSRSNFGKHPAYLEDYMTPREGIRGARPL